MRFRSETWRQRPKRFFLGREADTGEARVIVLTQGGMLNFESRGRTYSWSVGRRQCPIRLLQQAWWLVDIAEVRPSSPQWPDHMRAGLPA